MCEHKPPQNETKRRSSSIVAVGLEKRCRSFDIAKPIPQKPIETARSQKTKNATSNAVFVPTTDLRPMKKQVRVLKKQSQSVRGDIRKSVKNYLNKLEPSFSLKHNMHDLKRSLHSNKSKHRLEKFAKNAVQNTVRSSLPSISTMGDFSVTNKSSENINFCAGEMSKLEEKKLNLRLSNIDPLMKAEMQISETNLI